LDTLGITDTHIRWVNAVQGPQTATNAALEDLQALKPYRTTVRSIRHSLMSEWRKSAQSSGAASLLLERTRATMVILLFFFIFFKKFFVWFSFRLDHRMITIL